MNLKVFEIRTPQNSQIDSMQLDRAINELNRIFFKLEESIGHSSMELR